MSPALAGMSLGAPIKETHVAATKEAHALQWRGHTPQMKAQLSQKKNKKNDVCYTVSYPPNYQRIKELQGIGTTSIIGLKNLYPQRERLWNYMLCESLKTMFQVSEASWSRCTEYSWKFDIFSPKLDLNEQKSTIYYCYNIKLTKFISHGFIPSINMICEIFSN